MNKLITSRFIETPINRKTRFKNDEIELNFSKHGDVWRIILIDINGEHSVGEQYKSKAELLSDLPRYAKENWGF